MNIERIATVVFAVEGAVMVTATQSAHETELAGRLGRGVGDKISALLGAEKRSAAACQFERALRQKIVGQEESTAEILFGDIRAVITGVYGTPRDAPTDARRKNWPRATKNS